MKLTTLIKAIAWGIKEDMLYTAGNVQFLIKDFKEQLNQSK